MPNAVSGFYQFGNAHLSHIGTQVFLQKTDQMIRAV